MARTSKDQKSTKTQSRKSPKSSKRKTAKKSTESLHSDVRKVTSISEKEQISKKTTQKEADWRKRFLIPLIIVLLAVLVYIGLQQLIVATVNGAPISRLTLIKEMENQIGEQVLDTMVTRELILQAAKEQNIAVSTEEVDQEIASLKEQFTSSGQDFDQILAMQGLTMDRVREEVRLQLIIEKAVGADIEVTEEQVDEFIKQNKAFMPEDQDTQEEAFREDIKDQIKQQQVSSKMQDWIEELKSNARIKYFGSFAGKNITPTLSVDISPAPTVEETPQTEE